MTGLLRSQPVSTPLTRHATFLVLTIAEEAEAADAVRATLQRLGDLVKSVGFRGQDSRLSCVAGIGSDAWERVMCAPRPVELHPFRPIAGTVHTAVATPGDLLFHIRSDRPDLCFSLEREVLNALGTAVRVVDETVGFRFFDTRDLLGFVDGTANPAGQEVPEATVVGDEDPAARGGSYVVVQRYLHDLAAWERLSTEEQEAIIGRTKLEDRELPDAAAGQKSHKTLSTITGDDGTEYGILRDNMPFGSPGADEFGTYFVGYASRLWVIERMLQRMFLGDPPGAYDRILDVSRATTGLVFFAPSATALETIGAAASATEAGPADETPPRAPTWDGSLGLGGLRAAGRRTP
jgi:putative iron-dependent peroxidase